MYHRCQNIYDHPAEDISKEKWGAELAIANAVLLMQLPRILFHLLFTFSSFLFPAMKLFLSDLLRKQHIVSPPRSTMGKRTCKHQPCCSLPRIYPWVLRRHLWPDFPFSFWIHQIAYKYLIKKNKITTLGRGMYAPNTTPIHMVLLLVPFPLVFLHLGHFHRQLPPLLFLWLSSLYLPSHYPQTCLFLHSC